MVNRSFLVFTFLLCNSIGITQSDLKTPLEASKFTSLSSYDDMMMYLKNLDNSSTLISMEIIGESVQGRKLPVLYFTTDKRPGMKRNQKPVVLIFCQQHGDEPSGKEAALFLARKLIQEERHLLENLDLLLLPQMNPDGSEKAERRNANEMDLNRNHVILSEPETQALHRLFLEWMPEVTLDVHEYSAVSQDWVKSGFIKNADVQLGKVSNANIAPEIYNFSAKMVIPAVQDAMKKRGYTFH
ncbi:MAG: DUF2817 domain-containing protein, partial [bacterium]